MHQHGSDNVFRGRGGDEQSPFSSSSNVQEPASFKDDYRFATGWPTQAKDLLDVRDGAERLANGPPPLEKMHFHVRHGVKGQVDRLPVGADGAGSHAPSIV
jgi:hypothetical protein